MAKSKPTSLTIAPDPALTALKARTTRLLKTWQECTVTTTTDFESAGEGLKTTVQLRKDLKALPVHVELSRQKADIKAIENYKKALALGYTQSIPKIYEAAGIKFDFSPAYIKELMDFVKTEMP